MKLKISALLIVFVAFFGSASVRYILVKINENRDDVIAGYRLMRNSPYIAGAPATGNN